MSTHERITAFLAGAEVQPAASKLEPYTELIRELRRRRWTYQQIAAALSAEFSLPVAPSTVHAFVKVRAKRKGVSALPALDTPVTTVATSKPRFHLDC